MNMLKISFPFAFAYLEYLLWPKLLVIFPKAILPFVFQGAALIQMCQGFKE